MDSVSLFDFAWGSGCSLLSQQWETAMMHAEPWISNRQQRMRANNEFEQQYLSCLPTKGQLACISAMLVSLLHALILLFQQVKCRSLILWEFSRPHVLFFSCININKNIKEAKSPPNNLWKSNQQNCDAQQGENKQQIEKIKNYAIRQTRVMSERLPTMQYRLIFHFLFFPHGKQAWNCCVRPAYLHPWDQASQKSSKSRLDTWLPNPVQKAGKEHI